ncbi:hypothetical protein [Roseovarius atlanticus]|nr:hypothetical protein [Roseovarius atlanticus]MBY5988184.1 hypothetical protein [Roseovarius atlanticus]MBY6123575.1 hypothetical protein [Roseovarius atlanticus]MBY6148070.1 hypothetical protein [Roseovarius atlanticus]
MSEFSTSIYVSRDDRERSLILACLHGLKLTSLLLAAIGSLIAVSAV